MCPLNHTQTVASAFAKTNYPCQRRLWEKSTNVNVLCILSCSLVLELPLFLHPLSLVNLCHFELQGTRKYRHKQLRVIQVKSKPAIQYESGKISNANKWTHSQMERANNKKKERRGWNKENKVKGKHRHMQTHGKWKEREGERERKRERERVERKFNSYRVRQDKGQSSFLPSWNSISSMDWKLILQIYNLLICPSLSVSVCSVLSEKTKKFRFCSFLFLHCANDSRWRRNGPRDDVFRVVVHWKKVKWLIVKSTCDQLIQE